MGLSSKQVSSDHELDWTQTLLSGRGNLGFPKPRPTKRQQQQQQKQQSDQPLKCPRCDSTNTKFCYYNNYNKSQPRHFCKACKRHWTNGGTLRNVPVGGGRKNKRLRRPKTATSTGTSDTTMEVNNNVYMGYNLPSGDDTKASKVKSIDDEWRGSRDFYTEMQGLNGPTWDINGNFMLPQNQSLGFPLSSFISSFDPNSTSIPTSFPSLNGYKYNEKLEIMEDSNIMPSFTTSSAIVGSQQLQVLPSTSSFMDMQPNYWNWNIDVDGMVLADLNIPWDDSEFKP